jgi:hypothetical protein
MAHIHNPFMCILNITRLSRIRTGLNGICGSVHGGVRLITLTWVGWRGIASFGLPFMIYLFTLAPTVYNLDSAELTTAAYTGGLMRSTGYPLYLTLGYFWSKIPVGDVGYRMNLLSAIFGALTIFAGERILRRWQLGGLATFGALGLLATSPYFWGLSLVAEVYTLHTALMAGLILALLYWSDAPTPRRMAFVGLLSGLGMSHHAAMVLLIPGSLFYILSTHPKKALTPPSLLAFSLAMLVGLSFYLYLPLRFLAQPAFNYAGIYDANLKFHPLNLTSLEGFWWLISGSTFKGVMMAYDPTGFWFETRRYLVHLAQAFFSIGIGPGLLGIVLVLRRNWREGVMLALMFLLNAGFFINYRVLDKDTMFLPTYLIGALWVGIGLHSLLAWVEQVDPTYMRVLGRRVFGILVVSSVLLALAWNWSIVDLSADWTSRQRGEAILRNAHKNALVIGWWDVAPVAQYLQLVEGQRPDVRVINRFLIDPNDLALAIEKEVRYRSVYIDREPNDLSTAVSATAAGPLYQLVINQCRTESCQSMQEQNHR